jgi:NAD(P)-dependent dehydrogenase (short-subunit alcohol dehydrogenase family)
VRIDLSGRTALVTGSTAGIGRAVAAGLARAGAEVVVNGRSAERVKAAVRALSVLGRVRGVAADVGTAEGCRALVAAEPDVDVLVNNTGVFRAQRCSRSPTRSGPGCSR